MHCHAERSVSAAKHPHRTGFLALARNDTEKVLAMTWKDGRGARNDKREVWSSAAKPAFIRQPT